MSTPPRWQFFAWERRRPGGNDLVVISPQILQIAAGYVRRKSRGEQR